MLIGITDRFWSKQGCIITVPRILAHMTPENVRGEYSHVKYKFFSKRYHLANVCLNILCHSVSQDLFSCFYVQVRVTERAAAEIPTPTNIIISEAYLANYESRNFAGDTSRKQQL